MKSEGFFATVAFIAKRVAIAEIVVIVLIGVICWLVGWRTLTEYATGLILAGFAVMFFGASGVLSGATLNGDFQHQYSKTVMPNSANQHLQQSMSDQTEMSVIFLAGVIGVITIILGIVIKVFIYI